MSVRKQNYEIGRPIGKGEMAVTFKAQLIRGSRNGTESIDPQELAFKELNRDFALNASYRTKFLEEITQYRELALPNAVEVLDVVMTPDTLAVVMPFYEGTLLSSYIPKEGLPLVETLDILEPIADAIDTLHFHGMVHGNLKPKKILLAKRGMVPILLDVGVFKNAFWMGCIQLSNYRAPEDMALKRLTPMSDIYSFALIAYELLSGHLPWSRKLKEEEIQRLKEDEQITPLSVHCPNISVNLLGAIMDCLNPDPASRRPRCMDVVNYMRAALDEDEQTAEFANIDPVVLLEAQQAVARIDKELVKLEDKIRVKEAKLQQEQSKLSQTINSEKEKVAQLTGEDANVNEQSTSTNEGGFFARLFSFGRGAQSQPNQRKKRRASADTIAQAEEKMIASIEEHKAKYLQLETKIREELSVLHSEEFTLKEDLKQYGEIHPSLLGFRAVKPFSTAWLRSGRVKQQMILVPKGNFVLGGNPSSPHTEEDELPQHNVTISNPFWVLNAPVMQGLYRSITGKNPAHFKNEDHPIEMVSWFDAIKFCNALSEKEGLMPCYEFKADDEENVRWNRQANGFRLLTEAEWEYVARANGSLEYSGSNNAMDVAWFAGNAMGQTQPVRRKDPNLWGMYDMSGHVWEWCWDWFGIYVDGNATDPIGPKLGRGRVFRGGSFAVPERMLRVSQRGAERPHNRMNGLGFRLARNINR